MFAPDSWPTFFADPAPEIKGSTNMPGYLLHLLVAEIDDILAVGDFLPNGLVVGQRITTLADISQFNGIAETQRSEIRLSSPRSCGTASSYRQLGSR